LFAAAARMRVAQLLGKGYEDAAAGLYRLGVRNPERMTTAILPGLD
jgi:urea transporter